MESGNPQQTTGQAQDDVAPSRDTEAILQNLAGLVAQLARQQTEFNRVVSEQLNSIERQLQDLGDLVVQLDRNHSGQVRDLASLAVPVARLYRLLNGLEERLLGLEQAIEREQRG